jgi:hypothetical protein
MTKKDYVLIAGALRNSRPDPTMLVSQVIIDQWINSVAHFVSVFAGDNPRFDSVRFYDACGYRDVMQDRVG